MPIFEKIAENKIQEALERGDFDHLSNKGQPLNLDEYFATPEELRLAYSVLKSAKIIPAEIDLIREVGNLNRQIENCTDETEKNRLGKIRDEKQLQLRLRLERNRQK